MADEKKESAEAQAAPEAKPQEDYKGKYEALQGEYQKAAEQLKSAQATLDTLDQEGAINWDKVMGKKEPEPEKPEATDPKLQAQLQRQEGRLLMLQFRQDNPDLKDYEDDLVAPYVLRARQKHPRETTDQIMKRASDDVRSFLKKHEEAVLAKAKAAQIEQDKENASGLESAGQTTPESEVDEQQSRQQYVEHRRQQMAKRKRTA